MIKLFIQANIPVTHHDQFYRHLTKAIKNNQTTDLDNKENKD